MHNAPRVIIVEDEPLLALDLEDQLNEIGYTVVGIAYTEAEGFALLDRERPDIAILDIYLGAETTFALAATCARKGVLVVFASAYDAHILAQQSEGRPILNKPVEREALTRVLAAVTAELGGAAPASRTTS